MCLCNLHEGRCSLPARCSLVTVLHTAVSLVTGMDAAAGPGALGTAWVRVYSILTMWSWENGFLSPCPTFPFLAAALSSVLEYLISFCSDRPWLSCPRHKQEHGLLHPGVPARSLSLGLLWREEDVLELHGRAPDELGGFVTYPHQRLLGYVSCCFSQEISKVSKTCRYKYLKMIRKDCKLDIRSIFIIRNAEQHFWSRNISLLAVRFSI